MKILKHSGETTLQEVGHRACPGHYNLPWHLPIFLCSVHHSICSVHANHPCNNSIKPLEFTSKTNISSFKMLFSDIWTQQHRSLANTSSQETWVAYKFGSTLKSTHRTPLWYCFFLAQLYLDSSSSYGTTLFIFLGIVTCQ